MFVLLMVNWSVQGLEENQWEEPSRSSPRQIWQRICFTAQDTLDLRTYNMYRTQKNLIEIKINAALGSQSQCAAFTRPNVLSLIGHRKYSNSDSHRTGKELDF